MVKLLRESNLNKASAYGDTISRRLPLAVVHSSYLCSAISHSHLMEKYTNSTEPFIIISQVI